ncbi:MAG TPA: VWA domain-containing protein, partial [Thermoanaerobaculia bacterium]
MRPIKRLLCAFLLLPAAAFAQFEEKLTINYVEVPVTVVGRDGKPVRGLTQANFEVYDNSAKRSIESFEAIDFGAAETHKVISPLNPASRRNFLILFDTTFSSPLSLGRAQEAARDFVERGIGRRDLIAIATINVEKGFRLLTAFTSDRNLLAAAIAEPGNFRSHDPLAISSADFFSSTGPEGAGEDLSAGRGVSMENAVDFNRIQGQIDDAHRRMRVKKQFELFGEVASMLQRIRGRKHLVLLSEGFDARLVQGRDVASSREQFDENSAISEGRVWQVDSDVRFGNASMQAVLGEMAEEFRRADVVLHGVDIQGVRVQNDTRSGAKVNSNDGLFLLANSTGG